MIKNENGQLIDLLKLNLQFFAEEPEETDEPDEEFEDDTPDLKELLKDPGFKKQYNALFKDQLGKRMKKYEGVDPEEYKRLKSKEQKKKEDHKDEVDSELDTLKSELSQKEERLLRAERREKRALVKEYAIDKQADPKLLSRLINTDDIEMDEDGEPVNLDELYEELEQEFPQYFGEQPEKEEEVVRKKNTYQPGSNKKHNRNANNADPKSLGASKAAQRHKKEEN